MLQTDKDPQQVKPFHMLDCTSHACEPPQEPAPRHAHHALSPEAHRMLLLRNCAVVLAAALFFLSLFISVIGQTLSFRLRAIAYFFGAAAYLCEYLMMTDLRRNRRARREMLMSNVFGIMYIILGISYFNH